jgi:hypothetical protein
LQNFYQTLEIEFKFEYGTGYRLAAQTFLDEADITA